MPRLAPLSDVGSPVASSSPEAFTYAELDEAAQTGDAVLAEECALAIAYNGISHAVMMVSPSALEDFVVGFSLSGELVGSVVG